MAETELDGILLVDKPGRATDAAPETGLPTSHDVVQRVRRWSRQRRIGHTGTLDPMASGLLVLCLGRATRLVEYYQGHDKRYTAAVTLGVETDTYDALGEIVAQRPVDEWEGGSFRARVEDVLESFRGDIEQRPPVYSALKQGGESLHRKARRGEDVVVEPRPVTVYDLRLLSIDPPHTLWLDVRCSAGFYVRSLAHDIGQALGVGGHLSYLRRDAAGAFAVDSAHSLAAIEEAGRAGDLRSLLLPPGTGLSLPRLPVDADTALGLGQGKRLWLPVQSGPDAGALLQAVDDGGRLLGIVGVIEASTVEAGTYLCKAEKWLAPQD